MHSLHATELRTAQSVIAVRGQLKTHPTDEAAGRGMRPHGAGGAVRLADASNLFNSDPFINKRHDSLP